MQTAAQKQERLLRSAIAWQRRPYDTSRQAGPDIVNYLEKYLSESQRGTPVAAAFMRIVGCDLTKHCRPEKFDKGTLYVTCDPGPFMHQMRIMEEELIEKINTVCPRARLRKILLTVKK